ncbi:scarecrow-like protein 3 [Ananas comosus]|uniref:Scarecrow-like protein 3 n=1 Tax=Ananas comosus TaxID=4615 RepID=A0A6P5HB72_ANACO|nr:scarecrow-like protein 3 [Ananas comosus]
MGQDEFSPSTVTSSPLLLQSPWALAPFAAAAAASSPTPFLGYGGSPWAAAASGDRGVELINLLRQCAFDVDAGSLERADACLARIAGLLSSSSSSSASSASPTGGGGGGGGGQATRVHRLATIFTDALARRLLRRPLPGAYEALLAPAASSDPLLLAATRRHFFDLCPFLKLAFLTSNQAILEQMEGERVVHIVDLAGPAADPAQWLALLRALRARPEGPPHLRITAVHDDPDALHRTSALLSKEADAHDMSFQFHPVLSRLDALDFDSLRVKTGEALAVSSVLQLHSLLPPAAAAADSNSTAALALRHAHHLSPGSFGELLERELSLGHGHGRGHPFSPSPDAHSLAPTPPHSPRRIESFLSGLLALAPKIVVVTEQEANHNGAAFCERFSEALYYYAAMFDCLETTAPRSAAEWGRVERLLLGEQIRNIVACEGAERRERHERLQRWAQRLRDAGFGHVPLSFDALLEARKLLQTFGRDGYKVDDWNGCFFFCWHERPLYSVSAWRCNRLSS